VDPVDRVVAGPGEEAIRAGRADHHVVTAAAPHFLPLGEVVVAGPTELLATPGYHVVSRAPCHETRCGYRVVALAPAHDVLAAATHDRVVTPVPLDDVSPMRSLQHIVA
jgi:hypothetical protein